MIDGTSQIGEGSATSAVETANGDTEMSLEQASLASTSSSNGEDSAMQTLNVSNVLVYCRYTLTRSIDRRG